jgi:hypothetical protein
MLITKQKKSRSRNLSGYELETIINFNQGENVAYIFTYEKTWQKRLEQGLGLKPTMVNDSGGKEYKLLKSLIAMPRAKRKYSEETKKKMAQRLAKIRRRQPALL